MMAPAADQMVLDCYDRTNALWRAMEGQFRTWSCRFAILYGPANPEPDVFFVGINPGFDAATRFDDEIVRPPEVNEYASADWTLARRLRSLLADVGRADWLDRSNGSNTIFFKSNAVQRDPARPDGYYWLDNPLAVRRQLERHSMTELAALIGHLRPRRVVALGLTAFGRLSAAAETVLHNPHGRPLAATGSFGGAPLFGMIHPTGAQVSSEDRARVRDRLGQWLN